MKMGIIILIIIIIFSLARLYIEGAPDPFNTLVFSSTNHFHEKTSNTTKAR